MKLLCRFVHLWSEYSSQTPSVSVPSLMSETKFHTHTKLQEKLQYAYFNLYVLTQQTRRQKGIIWMVAGNTRISYDHNFLMKHNFDLWLVPKCMNLAIFMLLFSPAFWWEDINIFWHDAWKLEQWSQRWRPLVGSSSVKTFPRRRPTVEALLRDSVSYVSAPRLSNEDLRQVELELRESP
jgi:hypothetical protein